jgi:hypothetical protein
MRHHPPAHPPAHPPRSAPDRRFLLAIIFLAISVMTWMYTLLNTDVALMITQRNDLRAAIDAAANLVYGQPGAPPVRASSADIFIYPPATAAAFIPLLPLDPYLAFAIFTLLSYLVYGSSLIALCRRLGYGRRAGLWVALLGGLIVPALNNVIWGQSQLLLVGMILWAILAPSRLVGGLLIGLASYYKLYALLMLAAFFICGERRRAAIGLATLAGIGLLGLATIGWAKHLEFLNGLSIMTEIGARISFSLYGVFSSFGLELSPAYGTPLLGAAWLLGAWRLRRSPMACYAFTFGATLLISPIVWLHYFVFMVPPVIMLYRPAMAQAGPIRLAYILSALLVLNTGLINTYVAARPLLIAAIFGVLALALISLSIGGRLGPAHPVDDDLAIVL